MTEYERGWREAFDAMADYIDAEVCPVTAEMIRRMKNEKWRNLENSKQANSKQEAKIEE